MLLVCMFSGLTINWCTLPGKGYFSHSLHFLDACLLCSIEASGASPIHIGMSIGVIIVKLLCRQSYRWDPMGIVSDITRRHHLTSSHTISLVLWFSKAFCSLFCSVPWVLDVEVYLDITIGAGQTFQRKFRNYNLLLWHILFTCSILELLINSSIPWWWCWWEET